MAKNTTSKQDTNIAVMQTDIGYIKKSLESIELQLGIMQNNFVKKDDLKDIIIEISDHETRLRSVENSITKILTYGSAVIIGVTFLEFILNKYT